MDNYIRRVMNKYEISTQLEITYELRYSFVDIYYMDLNRGYLEVIKGEINK